MRIVSCLDTDIENQYKDFKELESIYGRIGDRTGEQAELIRSCMLSIYQWFRQRVGVDGKIVSMNDQYFRIYLERPNEITRVGSIKRDVLTRKRHVYEGSRKVV